MLVRGSSLVLLLVLSACSGEPGGCGAPPVPASQELAAPASLARGGALFQEHCALCHGESGDGHGVRRNLSAPPADLTDPGWRAQARPGELFCVIREGVADTPMAGWNIFDDEETWALVGYVLELGRT